MSTNKVRHSWICFKVLCHISNIAKWFCRPDEAKLKIQLNQYWQFQHNLPPTKFNDKLPILVIISVKGGTNIKFKERLVTIFLICSCK